MTYVKKILTQMHGVFKPQQKAILALLSALTCFSGKATMRNLSRYGWASVDFDYLELNTKLITHHNPQLAQSNSDFCLLFDATFIRKSGKHTEGLGYYHNGSSRSTHKIERGLEMNLIALGHLSEKKAYSLKMDQSFEGSALDIACHQIEQHSEELRELSGCIVADGYYAKQSFMNTVLEAGFELITLLRSNSSFRYLYHGEYSGRGRPRKFGEYVRYNNLDAWTLHKNLRPKHKVYSHIVYYPAWKRELLVVIKVDRQGRRRIYCSTDLNLSAEEILQRYELRFQIEFIFRDAKQNLGLGTAQTLDSQGQEHFANASLTALNILRFEERSKEHKTEEITQKRVSSIASMKRLKYNDFLLNYFFACLGKNSHEKIYQTAKLKAQKVGVKVA